jgi:hypothetical protein
MPHDGHHPVSLEFSDPARLDQQTDNERFGMMRTGVLFSFSKVALGFR